MGNPNIANKASNRSNLSRSKKVRTLSTRVGAICPRIGSQSLTSYAVIAKIRHPAARIWRDNFFRALINTQEKYFGRIQPARHLGSAIFDPVLAHSGYLTGYI